VINFNAVVAGVDGVVTYIQRIQTGKPMTHDLSCHKTGSVSHFATIILT